MGEDELINDGIKVYTMQEVQAIYIDRLLELQQSLEFLAELERRSIPRWKRRMRREYKYYREGVSVGLVFSSNAILGIPNPVLNKDGEITWI